MQIQIVRVMIKKFILAVLSVFVFLPLAAEKINVPIKGYKGNSQKSDQPILHRTPMRLPIDVVFDNETMTIQVSCVSNLEGEVFLYNASNELEDYSPCLNAILTLSNSNYHTILIEGDGWSATGVIE